MFYNNIIYLLVVILFFSMSSVPDVPQFPFLYGLTAFVIKLLLFREIIRYLFRRHRVVQASHYFAAEQRGSIIAIVFVAVDIFLLDCKYYLAKLPFAHDLPATVDLAGLLLFFLYLALVWSESARCYEQVFGRRYRKISFISNNFKSNFPIILPWLVLSFLSDILELLQIPALSKFLSSAWGEAVVLLTFFIILAVFFPVVLTRLWNCRTLDDGETRQRIEKFCEKQKLNYADILTWPLFEGQVITAGVIGIVGRFRYLLVTPALLRTMTPEEIEAVMAHEIGHVKRYHMQLYLFLFIGFALIAQLFNYPLMYFLLNSDLFYKIVNITNKEPGSAILFAGTLPLLILMIIYFRYIFGFFMRNFERQADLHVFKAMGDSRPLVHVLEKIAVLSGNIRDLPSWHHFGIGQRVDFLEECRSDSKNIKRHNLKVRNSLLAFVFIFVFSGVMLWQLPTDPLEKIPPYKFFEAIIKHNMEKEPNNFEWAFQLANLQHERKLFKEAIAAYEKTLELAPGDPEIMNNFAWLLLTAEDDSYHDVDRALILARDAARLKPAGYILDTLALAYFKSGFPELAIQMEEQAIRNDPSNREYYQKQLDKFSGEKMDE